MSRTAAAEQIIRSLAEGGSISYVECAGEMAALTQTDLDDAHDRHIVQAAMLIARERLIRAKVPAVRTVPKYGYVRMTHEDLVQGYGTERVRRGRRQFTRSGRAAEAADPEQLSGEARLKRDRMLTTAQAVAGIESRRAQRKRPLSVAD